MIVSNLFNPLSNGDGSSEIADVREAQAKRFFDLGVGREPGMRGFHDYLATIPGIPGELVPHDKKFPYLVLIETRLTLKRLCELGNIEFSGDDDMFVLHERNFSLDHPYWIRAQDGRKNRNRSVLDCRESFTEDEIGLTAVEGACMYLQHPESLTDTECEEGHAMSLPGSIHRYFKVTVACLVMWKNKPFLDRHPNFDDIPVCGSASRRKHENF